MRRLSFGRLSGSLFAVSLFAAAVACAAQSALPEKPRPAVNLTVPPGFKAELLHSSGTNEGSWICMTIDDKGRLIVSPQDPLTATPDGRPLDGGLLRFTLGEGGQVTKIERIHLPVGSAMGLLYAFDSLYVNGIGPQGSGIYRLKDTGGDDQFDKVELLKHLSGNFRPEAFGEHGPHAIVLGPDKMLYVINGNETHTPDGFRSDSPHRNYEEDQLLPPQLWPVNYTWANNPPPAGCLWKIDPECKEWTMICGGLRNCYDLAFNRDGEIITFDSDMDWDDGSPWYRPTRINHLVSGGEYGWRKGTGKWPDYYPDSLRSNLDVGRSSPTGMKFGSGTNFPSAYRRMLFACDWAFGTIYAVNLRPSGATYKATAEAFVTGKPLNVTDVEFGKDGAMYFVTGGRGTQSDLYRVSYTQPVVNQGPVWDLADQEGAKARKLRHELEAFHGKRDPKAVEFAWPHLNSDDRWIRYAARIAIEAQDVTEWDQRALSETRPNALINGLLALARVGAPSQQAALLEALGRLPAAELTEEQSLDALRVLQLACIRMGRPAPEVAQDIAKRLDAFYPAKTDYLNRELCSLLVYLESPMVIGKTLDLLATSTSQEQQMHYAYTLRNVKTGWTQEQRVAYFQWFPKAAAHYHGSERFLEFLGRVSAEAEMTLTVTEKQLLAPYLEAKDKPAATAAPAAPPRAFVKEWKMEDLLPSLDAVGQGRSFARGKELFSAIQCVLCHRLGGAGGAIGPDLSAAGSRYTRHDLLEAIVLPSKVIPDMFQNTIIVTKDGEDYTGRVLSEDVDKVVLSPNPLTPERVEILKKNIKSRGVSKLSPMPEGLLNSLTQEEILDLLAYVESGANEGAPNYRKAK